MVRSSIVALGLAFALGACSGPPPYGNGQNWFGANPDFRTPRPGPHGVFGNDKRDLERNDSERSEPF